MTTEVLGEAIGYCAAPECTATFPVALGRGRPRRTCSDACRRALDVERRRVRADVARLEKQLQRSRHYLEALSA